MDIEDWENLLMLKIYDFETIERSLLLMFIWVL